MNESQRHPLLFIYTYFFFKTTKITTGTWTQSLDAWSRENQEFYKQTDKRRRGRPVPARRATAAGSLPTGLISPSENSKCWRWNKLLDYFEVNVYALNYKAKERSVGIISIMTTNTKADMKLGRWMGGLGAVNLLNWSAGVLRFKPISPVGWTTNIVTCSSYFRKQKRWGQKEKSGMLNILLNIFFFINTRFVHGPVLNQSQLKCVLVPVQIQTLLTSNELCFMSR